MGLQSPIIQQQATKTCDQKSTDIGANADVRCQARAVVVFSGELGNFFNFGEMQWTWVSKENVC
jgi:hypothetical protein